MHNNALLHPPRTDGGDYDVLADAELQTILSAHTHTRRDVQRSRQVFTNRNLRMGRIELVGFDMDYTAAIYHKRSIEQLSFDMTLQKLVKERGYPAMIEGIKYDHAFVMRGLAVDRQYGNLLKMDRYSHVGRVYHGRRQLDKEEWKKLYRDVKVNMKAERFAWIDTLFALPEACLYAEIIELLEGAKQKVDYDKLYVDIRECIDTVHRDNSLKTEVKKDLSKFIFKDPELGPALHKLRSGGKKLFLLTNSLWDYTDAVMRYLLDGVLAEYPSWRNYFDIIVCGASKPAFFTETRPFLEVDPGTGQLLAEAHALERGRVYHGGNLADFEKHAGIGGERILYVGDHIYGDILKSKKSSLWRTCMIVEELEDEIGYTDSCQADIARLTALELMRARLDDEVNYLKLSLNALERRLEKGELSDEGRRRADDERRHEKGTLEKLRRGLKEATAEVDSLEAKVELGANPYWGLLFKEGTENSRFGQQVEQYACIYTSRVSNLLHYSPMQYFRSPRDFMPHERVSLNGKGMPLALAPLGSEGPPKGAGSDPG